MLRTMNQQTGATYSLSNPLIV